MPDRNHAEIGSSPGSSINLAPKFEIGAASGSERVSHYAPLAGTLATARRADFSRIGLRGYIRMARVMTEFFLFMLRVFLHTQRWILRKTPQSELRRREGALLREKLIKLGPTFIKTGQTLATRADILPVEYIQELAKLQDEVPPFHTQQARAIIEGELRVKIADIFESFEDKPVAAASLGQVHRATLRTGQVVAVKVQRPGIHDQIEFDISVLRRIARRLERYPNLVRGVDWQGTLDAFHTTIHEEMDYEQETDNAEVFRRNFAKWKEVYVPQIYPVFSTQKLIVMEFIDGYKVTDTVQLTAAGLNPPEIVKLLAKTYLKQLLEDGFFHADPHPGNLRVMADGRLAFFDFGMVGRLPRTLQSALLEAFGHLITRDVPGMVDDMRHLGLLTITPEAAPHVAPIVSAIVGRYLGRPLGEVSLHTM